MADLANNIRLAVDSGKVALGVNKVMDSIKKNDAKLVVVAAKNRQDILEDLQHISKISSIKTVVFNGNSMELGAICGKPYSVSALSIIEEGHSKILEEA
jgi:large subunit ribosomal protein L30e